MSKQYSLLAHKINFSLLYTAMHNHATVFLYFIDSLNESRGRWLWLTERW